MLLLWQQCFYQEIHMNYYTLLALLPVLAVSSYLNASVLELFFSTRGNFIIDFEQNYPSFPTQRVLWQNHHFCKILLFFLTYLTSWNSVFLLECPKGWANSSSQKLWITMDGWNWYWIHTWLVAEKCISFCFFIQFELLYSSKGSLWREEVSCITCRYLCYLLIPHNEQ